MSWAFIICGALVFFAVAALVYSCLEEKRTPWHTAFAGSF